MSFSEEEEGQNDGDNNADLSASMSIMDVSSSSLVSIQSPPPLQRPADVFSNNGGSGGIINVDNIFNAILDDTPSPANSNFTAAGGNGIDHNVNERGPLSILIAPKKSHNFDHGSSQTESNNGYNVIPTYYNPQQSQQQSQTISNHNFETAAPTTTNEEETQQSQRIEKGLSKSMGGTTSTSFLLKHRRSDSQQQPYYCYHDNNNNYYYNNHRRQQQHLKGTAITTGGVAINSSTSAGDDDNNSRVRTGSKDYYYGIIGSSSSENFIIELPRHAGYLLKRSNLPFATTATVATATKSAAPPDDTIIPTTDDHDETVQNNNDGGSIQGLLLSSSFDNYDDCGDDGDDDDVEKPSLFTLPFGGLDCSIAPAAEEEEEEETAAAAAAATATGGSRSRSCFIRNISDGGEAYNIDDDEKEDEIMEVEEDQCFCAPVVQFFRWNFGRDNTTTATTLTTKRNTSSSKMMMTRAKNLSSSTFGSPTPTIDSQQQNHFQPSPQPLLNEVVVSHQIPLKGPARSDPLPISPRPSQDDRQRIVDVANFASASSSSSPPHLTSSARAAAVAAKQDSGIMITTTNRSRSNSSGSNGRVISHSYSNDESSPSRPPRSSLIKLPLTLISPSATTETTPTTTTSVAATNSTTAATTYTSTKKKKEYPAPPPDYIDPRDGHIWRAKYCVLEEGILYFYRNAEVGESDEAQAERNESRSLSMMMMMDQQQQPQQHLCTSPSFPIVSIERTGGSSTATTSFSKLGKKDLFDLSKSPMPMKKSYLSELRSSSPSFNRPAAAAAAGGGGGNNSGATAAMISFTTTATSFSTFNNTLSLGQSPIMHHSISTSTFHHDTDILWEKRVALDCVGAVRSSVQEHGDHSFELLAYGVSSADDDDDDEDEQSDGDASSTRNSGGEQQQQHEIIDRLILRAGSYDDMNTWMFQFHRSLASYMQRIVNSALNNRHHHYGTNALLRKRPDSPIHQLHQHRRIGTPVGSSSNNNKQKQPSSSPMGSSYGSNFSPNITGPLSSGLSHGHGRNAIYRRQVRDLASPLSTPGGSPVDIHKAQLSSFPIIVQSESFDSQKKAVGVLGLREVRKSVDVAASSSFSNNAAVVTSAAAQKKYIPPHLRRRMEAASKGGGISVNSEIIEKTPEKQVALNDSFDEDDDVNKKETKDKTQSREDSFSDSAPSDSALSTTSSLLSRQLEDSNIMSSSHVHVRLGGCADPTVSVGSILDDVFIPRKASVLGNARLEPFGGIGGGFFTSTRSIQVEEDTIPFDDDDDDLNHNGNRAFLSGLKWEVGASSECGVRNSNEDSYVVINNLDEMISSQGLTSFADQYVGQTKQQGLFAIFDGHVGNQAARFSAEKFPEMLMEEQSVVASRDSASLSSIQSRTFEVLRKAFDRLDREFCSLCTRDGRDWDCGSTALAALVVDNVVTLANLGDCRGVVCRVVSSGFADIAEWQELDPEDEENMLWDRANGGDAFSSGERLLWREITETHSPLLSEERERIENANGWIIHETEIPTGQLHRMDFFDDDVVEIVKRCFADRLGQHRSDPARRIQIARTCGDLAVSRAIGDRDFKAAYNLPRNNRMRVVENQMIAEEREMATSWEGPKVFIYPEGHSGRFRGDLVSSVPDVKFFMVGQDGVKDEFLLMACDGLWDVMDGDDAVRIAKDLLFDKKLSAKDGAERLAELAKHLGSSDNITVILIRFYWEEIDTSKLVVAK